MFSIEVTSLFKRNIKNLVKKDYSDLLDNLKQGEFVGDEIQGFSGDNVYKAHISSIDQRKGKSGGFRVIYYVDTENQAIHLMNSYTKSAKTNIDPNTLEKIKRNWQ